MNEHQLLDELAADAPTPSLRFADDILVIARRRRRRVWAVASASVGAVLVAVAVPVAVQLGRSDDTSVAAGPGPSTTSSTPSGGFGGPPGKSRDEVAEIYAAALKYAALSPDEKQGTQRTEVRRSTCTDLGAPSQACRGARRIPAATRHDVLTLLPDGSGVRFVDGPSSSPPGSKTVLFVTLGPARISGTHARVFVQSWCGFDCARGQGLILKLVEGMWQVTGTYGGYIT